MGHKISKEQIDPGVKDYIMSFVGDINELETDDKSNIINAVNSLMVDRVDNAENMGKLANAIGEPVTANHSVDEVVEGLGEMLSTFKTNMMNSGVMVESSDKFKQLIDKIKGLTEGEGNKGIQMTSGVINVKTSFPMGSYKSLDKSTNKSLRKLTIDCGFIPNLVIATTNLGGTMDFSAYIGGLGNENSFYSGSGGRNISGSGSLYPLSSEGFVNNSIVDLPVSLYGDYTYYAIGVGEEDTTLRDSLASILQEEGVSVTEEDDMASLIGKVDEEFDRKIDVKSGSYISPITMTEDIRKITITHNLGKAPSFISIYIPYTSLYYLYGGYENYLQASTTRAMNYIIDSRVYYDADHRFIVLADSNRYMHAYITDITNTSFSFAMCCGKEGSGYEIHLDSFDWVVM